VAVPRSIDLELALNEDLVEGERNAVKQPITTER